LRNDERLAATLFVWPLIGNVLLNFRQPTIGWLLQRSDLAGRDQKRVGRDEARRGAANKLPVLWHCLTAAPIDTEIHLANAPAHISAAAGPRGSGTVRVQSLSPLIAHADLGTVSDRSPGAGTEVALL
jgi:hypothetical protein